MAVRVCSLIVDTPQTIPADGAYHLLRFPYSGESADPHRMHQPGQPDGADSEFPDPRSGLIWPAVSGWGELKALVYWDEGDYTEVRDRFVRDPLSLSTGSDSTCTEDHQATTGGQYRGKAWGIFVEPETPLGVMVRHNGTSPATVSHAQFKLAILT
ncbi:hypothetical protein ACFOVU_21370 [Nocardiopsis sediminis]|uniref:Uncharacterized protein n=1 Tax=Nocardiopsis sediminis TaxID=1778267 RepID=A0ABV8FSX4_9ACTN